MFKVIDGNPKPVKILKRDPLELKAMEDLIRAEPEVYMVNGHDIESVLAFADTLDTARQFDIKVTDDAIKKMFEDWVRAREFERIHKGLADLAAFANEEKDAEPIKKEETPEANAERLILLQKMIKEIDQMYARPERKH